METIDEIFERARKKIAADSGSDAAGPVKPARLPAADLGDPDCPICHGLGFVARDVPFGDPDFGKMDVCSCRKEHIHQAQADRRLRESNLDGYREMTFERFNVKGRGQLRPDYEMYLTMARDHALKFAREREGWLLLMGRYGTGKTHLAAAIANEALADQVPNIFLPVPDLLDWLRAGYQGYDQSFVDRFEQLCSIPLLVLDDLGTQNSTPWAEEKLFQILNYRYVQRLPTVITTNLALKELDGRLASRLEDPSLVMKVVIVAPDYRNPTADGVERDDLSILHLLMNRTFDSFDSRKREALSAEATSQLANAYQKAFAFAQNPDGWIVFSGANGSGKTHLAAAIGNYRRKVMESPLFVVASDLLDHLRATFSPESPTRYDTMFEKVRNTPLLILDHLDTAYATPWAKEKLYQILNYRYMVPLPTVITTVLPVQDLDPNIRSRLLDFQICTIVQMFQIPMYSRNPDVDILPERTRKAGGFRRGK